MALKMTIGGVPFVSKRTGVWEGQANGLTIRVAQAGKYWTAYVQDDDLQLDEDGDGVTPADALAMAISGYTFTLKSMLDKRKALADKILAGATKFNNVV